MKPRVLIIGDSISVGYTEPVKRLLADVADVERIPVNGGPTTRGVEHLSEWLGETQWDVIHFNFGLHDLKRMEDGRHQVLIEQYALNLQRMVHRMQQTGARLIWASTTPVPEGSSPPRMPEDAVAYNEAAAAVMVEAGVPINDLHSLCLPRLAELQLPANVHFSEHGSEVLGEWVAEAIREELQG